jgi:hypothetical protein
MTKLITNFRTDYPQNNYVLFFQADPKDLLHNPSISTTAANKPMLYVRLRQLRLVNMADARGGFVEHLSLT